MLVLTGELVAEEQTPVITGTIHPDLCISRGGTPQYLKATANNPLSCPSPQPIQGRPGSELPPVAGSPLHLRPGEIRSQGWVGVEVERKV